MIIHGTKANQKMTINIPKLKNPNTKKQAVKKPSPKIRIMNTKRDNRGDNMKRNNLQNTLKSPRSISESKKSPYRSKYGNKSKSKRNYKDKKEINDAHKKKDYIRAGYRQRKGNQKKKNVKKHFTRTAKDFDKLNESDAKKLDEIKREFQKKFAIDSIDLNQKSTSKSKGIFKKII
jgi:hypothetical protein